MAENSLTLIVNKAKIAAFNEVINAIKEPIIEIENDFPKRLIDALEERINELNKRVRHDL